MDVTISHLTKRYGGQKAVDDISFSVKTGEILGFLGPNGAGKTTTMKMITNYIAVEEGDILIGGRSVRTDAAALKAHIGYLPEHNPLYQDMPVLDYLAFCAALQNVPRADIPGRVEEMVRVCGLREEQHKTIGELSKGYRQRVGLAQAMIHDPDLLILDEPTTGLDPNQIVEIRKLIRELGREKTVILSTHILPEVEATCDRILIIHRGRIVADGTADRLRSQARGRELLTVGIEDADAAEARTALAALPTVAAVAPADPTDPARPRFTVESRPEASSRRAVFDLCVARGWALTEMTPLETKLEDIFRELTTDIASPTLASS